MAGGGLPAYNDPVPEDLEPLDVDETNTPDTNVIHIDGKTGQVSYEQDDGSLVVNPPGTDQKPEGPKGFDDNLAEDFEVPIQSICHRLMEGIEADIQSRREWEETANRGRSILGVKLEDASSSVSAEGTISRVQSTELLGAVLQSWANSRAELLPAGGPVKVSDDLPDIDRPEPPQMGHNGGPPMDGSAPPASGAPPPAQSASPQQPRRSQLADALEQDMNHYLTVVDREYVPSFSQMLLNRAVDGVQFRKVFRCPLRRRPVSDWVKGADLIVSNDASHLSGAGRVTERIKMRQTTVKRLQAIGHWRKVALVMPNEVPTPTDQTVAEIQGTTPMPQLPADQQHTIYECYCELDDGSLANDETGKEPGFPLPYRVTIDKDSQTVLEIRRNWKQGDEDYTARRRYVKYGFVPGFGFYDWGLVHIIGNPQRALTAIGRILIDTGMFKSFPGWLMAKGPGTRQRSSEIRPSPGEAVVIDTGGLPIQQVVMNLPYGEPSAVLQAKAESLAGDMRRISGVLNMPVGEGRLGNVPAATMMAYVDSITKVPSAIHKDDHTAQAEEFGLLKELFQEEPEALTRGVKRPSYAQGYTAEELADRDLVPAADPNIPSHVHRVMQTNALVEAASSPAFQGIANPRGIWKRVCQVLGVESPDDVTMPVAAPAPPSPPPQVVVAQIRAKSDSEKTAAQVQTAQIKEDAAQTEAATEQQERQLDRESDETRASMALAGKVIDNKTKVATHAVSTAADQSQHADTIAQGDRHKAADLVQSAAQSAMPEPDNTGGSQ